MTYKQAQSIDAQVLRGEKGTLVQYWKFNDQVPVKDERGKPVRDGEGNKVCRAIQLDKPRVFSASVKSWIEVLKEDPKEILRASRDADKITGYVLELEKERVPANVEKLSQIERPAAPEVVRSTPAPSRARATGGWER